MVAITYLVAIKIETTLKTARYDLVAIVVVYRCSNSGAIWAEMVLWIFFDIRVRRNGVEMLAAMRQSQTNIFR